MLNTDILIIGAGAAGLIAARDLSAAGKQVIVLEARNRIGGRIFTSHDAAFSKPVETGPEFIHGNLPITLALLKHYSIPYTEVNGELWHCYNGRFSQQNDFIEYAKLLDKPLKQLHSDKTVTEFLNTLPNDAKHEELKYAVTRYVEGYDAADAGRASAMAFRDEWQAQDDEQYRTVGGYNLLTEALANDCRHNACRIVLSMVVKTITWQQERVEVVCTNGESYSAKTILVTVPLGIMLLPPSHKNVIRFSPPLPEKEEAAKQLGYGVVIKLLLEFTEPFWAAKQARELTGHNLSNMGFLFTDTRIPTWWTQQPDNTPLLTGWIAGPAAEKICHQPDGEILNEALNVLAFMFQQTPETIKSLLKASHVANWGADEFSHGAYSYTTVHSRQAAKIFSAPVANTLFFAGEACYSGNETGMVEGALGSGIETAQQILRLVG